MPFHVLPRLGVEVHHQERMLDSADLEQLAQRGGLHARLMFQVRRDAAEARSCIASAPDIDRCADGPRRAAITGYHSGDAPGEHIERGDLHDADIERQPEPQRRRDPHSKP